MSSECFPGVVAGKNYADRQRQHLQKDAEKQEGHLELDVFYQLQHT